LGVRKKNRIIPDNIYREQIQNTAFPMVMTETTTAINIKIKNGLCFKTDDFVRGGKVG